MTTYSPFQFAVFRISLGLYAVVIGLLLLPYSEELLSDRGMLENYARGFRMFSNFFPNVLEASPTPAASTAAVVTLIVAGAGLAAGTGRRLCALVVWYTLTCLLGRNSSLINPAMPFVGWLCLATLIVPLGEGLSLRARAPLTEWRMPKELFRAAWILMAVAYTFSGLTKLASPAWVDGSALSYIIDMPFAREGGFAALFAHLPDFVLRFLTWFTLVGEIGFVVLCLARRGRLIAWLWMLAMHLMLLLIMDFAELTIGMALIHLFTFDARWLPPEAISRLNLSAAATTPRPAAGEQRRIRRRANRS